MALTPLQIEAVVNANAVALDLRIAAEHKSGVLAFFALAAGMADLVLAQPLDIDDESGSVFTPIAPEAGE